MRKGRKCKSANYSFILMRDDCTVKTWYLRKSFVRFFFYTFLLLILGTFLACFAAYRYVHRYYTLQGEYKTLKSDYTKAKLELEHLTNVKTLVEQTSDTELVSAKNEEITNDDNLAQVLNQANATTPLEPESTNIPDVSRRNNSSFNSQTSEEEKLIASSVLMDKQTPLTIANFLWRGGGNSQISVQYDLLVQNGKLYSGKVRYFAESGTGKIISLQNAGEGSRTSFSISRLKKMESLLSLNKEFPLGQLKRLIILLELDDGELLHWSFSFARS